MAQLNIEVHVEGHSEVLRLYEVSEYLFKQMAVAFLGGLSMNIFNTSQIIMPKEGYSSSVFDVIKSNGKIGDHQTLQVQVIYS